MKKTLFIILTTGLLICAVETVELFAQTNYAPSNPIQPRELREGTSPQSVRYSAPFPPRLAQAGNLSQLSAPTPPSAILMTTKQGDSNSVFQEMESMDNHTITSPSIADIGIPQMPYHTHGYSIAELQQLALQYNPLLAKKQREIRSTYGTWLQAGLYSNPTLEIISDDHADDGTNGKQGFAIDQEIIRGNKLKLSRNVASWEIEIAKREWQIVQQKVINDVRALSYDLLATQYLILVYEKLVAIGDLSVQHAEMIQQSGEGSKSSMLQNRIQRNEAIIAHRKAIQDEKNDWNQLVAMIGLPHLEQKSITDNLDQRNANLDINMIWQQLLQFSPEYKAELQKLSRAQCTYHRENAEKISNVTLRGEYGYHVSDEQNVGALTISIPLKIYNQNQGNIQKAHSDIHAQGREIERKEMDLSRRLTMQWNTYEKALETINLYELHILPDAKEAIDISIQMAQHGEASQLELFIAQSTYNNYLVNYTNALRELAKSVVYLEGFLLEGGLTE